MESFFEGMAEEMTSGVSLHNAAVMVPRLVAAVLLGTVLSVRPWRRLMGRPPPRSEMVQAQIQLCTAAAILTAVIGNSMAKAFGLVGLGGFVRFKSGLKDPRDAALLFLMIGLGMACGHGSLGLAWVGTLFISALLWLMEALDTKESTAVRQRLLVSAQADDLAGAEEWLRKTLGARNVLVRSCALDFAARRVELEVEEKEPGTLARALGQGEASPVRGLRWSELPVRKGAEG